MFFRPTSVRPTAAFALGILIAAGAARGAFADSAVVAVGDLRTPVSSTGVSLRAEARNGSAVLGAVAHGTRFRVLSTKQQQVLWLQVTADTVKQKGVSGWLRSSETVQPGALSGGGGVGTVAPASAEQSAGDAAAAGRGAFDGLNLLDVVEGDPRFKAAMAQLERMIGAKPTLDQVQAFAKAGRLGRPGR